PGSQFGWLARVVPCPGPPSQWFERPIVSFPAKETPDNWTPRGVIALSTYERGAGALRVEPLDFYLPSPRYRSLIAPHEDGCSPAGPPVRTLATRVHVAPVCEE